jgi:hypothetical protein
MPPDTVSVCRPGPYGNPFMVGRDGDAAGCVAQYRAEWTRAVASAKRDRTPYMPFGKPVYLGPLIGKNLACWCALTDKDGNPVPCHADVLIEIANSPTFTNGERK